MVLRSADSEPADFAREPALVRIDRTFGGMRWLSYTDRGGLSMDFGGYHCADGGLLFSWKTRPVSICLAPFRRAVCYSDSTASVAISVSKIIC